MVQLQSWRCPSPGSGRSGRSGRSGKSGRSGRSGRSGEVWPGEVRNVRSLSGKLHFRARVLTFCRFCASCAAMSVELSAKLTLDPFPDPNFTLFS